MIKFELTRKKSFKTLLFKLVQWTWGFPQTFLGFLFSLFLRAKGLRSTEYRGATAFQYDSKMGYVSLGAYMTYYGGHMMRHEYGHCIQSLILGPLYLFIIGIPSITWAILWKNFKHLMKIETYYWFYTEAWANRLGRVED